MTHCDIIARFALELSVVLAVETNCYVLLPPLFVWLGSTTEQKDKYFIFLIFLEGRHPPLFRSIAHWLFSNCPYTL